MRTFHVQTYSHVKGVQVIRADTPEEALAKADADMKESLERLIRTTELHPDIVQISGNSGAEGTPIEIQEEKCWVHGEKHLFDTRDRNGSFCVCGKRL